MRILLPLLLVPFLCLSQTAEQRQKIVATYNQEEIAALNSKIEATQAEQKRLIAEYIAKNPSYKESETHSLQRIIDGVPIFFTTFNQGSSQTIGTNRMYPGASLGLNVTGSGITAGVWDGGKVRNTHIELNNKITLGDDSTDLSAHATHVTGTIMAAGVSASRKGIAYGAQAMTYDWFNDNSEMSFFGSEGYLVSNHSYGYDTASLPDSSFGAYDSSSIEIDELSVAYPYYQIVIAAGNDRNSDLFQAGNEGGYDLLSGTATSKNGITVAAVEGVANYIDPNSVFMSDFSNFGPPDDGRIKPDIAAKGVAVNSCVSTGNNAYDIYNGTSMAAPAISGMIVLLQKHFSNLNGDSFMKAATVRGLICHSAREAGFWPGPDYEFGWGLANAEDAANIISQRGVASMIEENTLSIGQTYTTQISISSGQPLIATICWTDPKGSSNGSANDNRVPRLKNNLDLKILKDGNTYYPWKLNVEDPFASATNDSDNDVDNVEKVELDFAEPGVYTIQVTHKGTTLLGGSQDYSLITSAPAGVTLAVNQSDFDNNIVVYPNPAKDVLNFAVPNNGQISNVAVYDIVGKEVRMNQQLQANAIDISNLSSGIYFAKFEYEGQMLTKKFIKE